MDLTEETEESHLDSLSKEQENETYPLRTMDIIDNVSDKIQKTRENRYKIYFITFFVVSFLFVLIFLILFIISNSSNNNDIDNSFELKIYNPQKKNNLQKSITKNSINNQKINVAFLYSSLSGNGIARFMIVTGEYFLKTGKYNVYFFTKQKGKKELSYNEKIKRLYVYNNATLIQKACKEEKNNSK